jgi:ribosome-associated protein
MDSKKLAYSIAELILEKKGTDVKILNLTDKTSVTDYFVICSAASDTQVKAIADHITKELREIGERVWHSEGYQNLSWVLLDFVDAVAHIFHADTRRFFNLEGIWGDCEITEIDEKFNFKKVK